MTNFGYGVQYPRNKSDTIWNIRLAPLARSMKGEGADYSRDSEKL